MASKIHNRHDHSYKLLFSHPEMVRDLLTGFVKEAWVEQLDFSTLEKVSGSYVTEDLRDREDDIIWRVRWGDDWLYVYLLLEFQSSEDKHMAVRIMTYQGLPGNLHPQRKTAADLTDCALQWGEALDSGTKCGGASRTGTRRT